MNEKEMDQLGALITEVMGPDDLGPLGKETLAICGEVFNRLQKKKRERNQQDAEPPWSTRKGKLKEQNERR